MFVSCCCCCLLFSCCRLRSKCFEDLQKSIKSVLSISSVYILSRLYLREEMFISSFHFPWDDKYFCTFVLLFAVVITKRLLSPEKDAVVAQVTPVFVYSSVIAFPEFSVLFCF